MIKRIHSIKKQIRNCHTMIRNPIYLDYTEREQAHELLYGTFVFSDKAKVALKIKNKYIKIPIETYYKIILFKNQIKNHVRTHVYNQIKNHGLSHIANHIRIHILYGFEEQVRIQEIKNVR